MVKDFLRDNQVRVEAIFVQALRRGAKAGRTVAQGGSCRPGPLLRGNNSGDESYGPPQVRSKSPRTSGQESHSRYSTDPTKGLPVSLGGNMADSSARSTPSLWRPLRTPIFRNLLLADVVVSDVGTFMPGVVGAAWLMISLNAGPMYVRFDPDSVRPSPFSYSRFRLERLVTSSIAADSIPLHRNLDARGCNHRCSAHDLWLGNSAFAAHPDFCTLSRRCI